MHSGCGRIRTNSRCITISDRLSARKQAGSYWQARSILGRPEDEAFGLSLLPPLEDTGNVLQAGEMVRCSLML